MSESSTTGALTIPLKTLSLDAVVPQSAYTGDAGVDLCSTEALTLKPFERRLVATGLALAIPEGFAGFVVPRSGLAIKQGLSVVNAPGLIDSNYRGEIKVILINLDAEHEINLKKGDRIAQLVIMKVEGVQFKIVNELSTSDRGAGGFGSSGVAGA